MVTEGREDGFYSYLAPVASDVLTIRSPLVLVPPNGWLEGPFNQPAKQAKRVLAPGDGEAEPGETEPNTSQPTKWATDETCKKVLHQKSPTNICRQLRRLWEIGGRYPRLGFAIAWG